MQSGALFAQLQLGHLKALVQQVQLFAIVCLYDRVVQLRQPFVVGQRLVIASQSPQGFRALLKGTDNRHIVNLGRHSQRAVGKGQCLSIVSASIGQLTAIAHEEVDIRRNIAVYDFIIGCRIQRHSCFVILAVLHLQQECTVTILHPPVGVEVTLRTVVGDGIAVQHLAPLLMQVIHAVERLQMQQRLTIVIVEKIQHRGILAVRI